MFRIGSLVTIKGKELFEVIDRISSINNKYYCSSWDSSTQGWYGSDEISPYKGERKVTLCTTGVIITTDKTMKFLEFPTSIDLDEFYVDENYKDAWLNHFKGKIHYVNNRLYISDRQL